ncbi:rod shape-determining protein MreC [uncultured Alistipes sp.]|uniref:rod shape-determining protein MreC n=1 Tax=uncultured Alistipes sp. TaxID=538949 RepID=UPI0025F8DDCC|nr:rod shape-determining protein MreC [uncultured Alistipes sp.]
MHKLVEFIRSIYVLVLFVALEVLAIGYYARSSYYTEARLLAHSNRMLGALRGLSADVRRYFRLEGENRVLLERVAQLEERLAQYEEADAISRLQRYVADLGDSKYRVMTASVVSNSINRAQNFITVNRGRNDGVIPDMAVLTPDGAVVGYVVDCTERYAVAMPVLNTSFRASGKLAGADYCGSILWDGGDPHAAIFAELSKYAEPMVGQEVLTTGFSHFFPEDVLIGWVESATMNETRTAYTVRVRLAADFARLTDVILVENRDFNQLQELEHGEGVEQYLQKKQ